MDVTIANGGAVWDGGGTIYQVIYDTAAKTLILKVTGAPDPQWTTIPLGALFDAGTVKSGGTLPPSAEALSRGEEVGIGVGSGVGVLATVAVVVGVFIQRSRRSIPAAIAQVDV